MQVSRNGRKVTLHMSAEEARDLGRNLIADGDAEEDDSPKAAAGLELLRLADETGD